MRAFELIFEKTPDPLSDIKSKVITKVKQTNDGELLNKIYSSFGSTDLSTRLASAFENENDIRGYLDTVVESIIATQGTYEDKLAFAEGLSKGGYIDLNKMLSGNRVSFDDILKVPPGGPSINFIKKVLQNLRFVGEKLQKGPGEFAIAILSPGINIFGKGDLKIGDKIIEVKASGGTADKKSSGGGRLGTTGFLNHERVPEIIQKYFPNINTEKTLGLTELGTVAKTNLTPEQRKALGQELFSYIFSVRKGVDIGPLVNAFVEGKPLDGPYIKSAYQAYKGTEDSQQFDGMMVINFVLEDLKYYEDIEDSTEDFYGASVTLISSNKGFSARNIIPTVTLRPEKVEKVELPGKPKKGTVDTGTKEILVKYADALMKIARVRDPLLRTQIIQYVTDLFSSGKYAPTTFRKLLIQKFPQLQTRTSKTTTPIQ
jgi:hypothetical protein